jgi:hypothetical protein
MHDRILINPENRMLGTSGTNDFSLYGAPSDPGMTVRPSPSPDPAVPGSAAPAATPQDAATASIAAPPAQSSPLDTSGDVHAPPFAQPSALAAASPIGSPPDASGSEGGGAPVTYAPGGDRGDPGDFATIVGYDHAPNAEAGQADLSSSLDISALAAPVLSAQSPSASEQAALLESVSGTVSLVTDGLTPSMGEPVPEIAVAVSADDTLGAIDDGVEDLLGSDPAAGIATLVSLVSVSDVLDVQETGTGTVDAAQDLGAGLLDTLAADPFDTPAHDDAQDHNQAEHALDAVLLGTGDSLADDLPPDPLG